MQYPTNTYNTQKWVSNMQETEKKVNNIKNKKDHAS